MKKISIALLSLGLLMSSTFAYTASASLKGKISLVAEAIMDIIIEKRIGYGVEVVELLEGFEAKFEKSGNERNQYIAQSLIDQIKPFVHCTDVGGTWLTRVNECENISEELCDSELGGVYDECASACRHDEDDSPCIMSCIPVCKLP